MSRLSSARTNLLLFLAKYFAHTHKVNNILHLSSPSVLKILLGAPTGFLEYQSNYFLQTWLVLIALMMCIHKF